MPQPAAEGLIAEMVTAAAPGAQGSLGLVPCSGRMTEKVSTLAAVALPDRL